MTYETTLAKAIAILRSGGRITRSMAAQLAEEGYDVPSLTNAYLPK